LARLPTKYPTVYVVVTRSPPVNVSSLVGPYAAP
jgi:hypothetical protein